MPADFHKKFLHELFELVSGALATAFVKYPWYVRNTRDLVEMVMQECFTISPQCCEDRGSLFEEMYSIVNCVVRYRIHRLRCFKLSVDKLFFYCYTCFTFLLKCVLKYVKGCFVNFIQACFITLSDNDLNCQLCY